MAIINNVELPSGIIVENAYRRISAVSGNKELLALSLDSYISQQAYAEGKSLVNQQAFAFAPSVDETALNFIKQGYEYLKTLPELATAVDV